MKLNCGSCPKRKSPPSLSEPAELLKCVFPDSLVTVSEGGRDLGKFSVTVEFACKGQQPCMLLHAQSQGAIDDSPCGTTVTGEGGRDAEKTGYTYTQFSVSSCPLHIQAYLTTDLEVLEEDYHEYVKVSPSKLPTLSHFDIQNIGTFFPLGHIFLFLFRMPRF